MKNKFLPLTAIAALVIAFFFFTSQNEKRPERNNSFNERDYPQKRIEWEFNQLKDPATNKIPDNIRAKELEFAKSFQRADEFRKNNPEIENDILDAASWQSNGPNNIGGRTRALAFDISDASYNTLLAGGVSGGMFRSTNNGTTWTRVTSLTQLASVTAIVQDRKSGKTNTWYYGTGERIGNSASGMNDDSYLGDGIFKSVDGGLTWNLLPSTVSGNAVVPSTFSYVFRLAMDYSNTANDEIYAAIPGGIMRSLDGGNTWSTVLGNVNSGTASDVIVTSSGVVYATISSDAAANRGFWRSATGDAGDWTSISPADLPANHSRTVLAAAPSNENIVYFLTETPGSGTNGNSLWKYTYISGNGSGAGGTWSNRNAGIPDGNNGIDAFNSQGSYNLVIAVKPDNEDVVFIGGVDLIRSTNGFTDRTQNI